MWLSPQEPSVHKVHLGQTFESLQTHGQQLTRLQTTPHPCGRGLEVPEEEGGTKVTCLQYVLTALCNILPHSSIEGAGLLDHGATLGVK